MEQHTNPLQVLESVTKIAANCASATAALLKIRAELKDKTTVEGLLRSQERMLDLLGDVIETQTDTLGLISGMVSLHENAGARAKEISDNVGRILGLVEPLIVERIEKANSNSEEMKAKLARLDVEKAELMSQIEGLKQ